VLLAAVPAARSPAWCQQGMTAPAGGPAAQLSPECKDLLNKIFVIDAKKRISIEQIEKHPW
jgi:hypothetical protein